MTHRFTRSPGCFLLVFFTLATLVGCEVLPAPASTTPAPLRYALPAAPSTLDPARAMDRPSLDVVGLLYEGLTRYDPQTATVTPGLAEAWDVSGNGLTYTFKMRAGAHWVTQEGEIRREVTAEDVVFAIQRACDPATLAPHALVLSIIEGCAPDSSDNAEDVQVQALNPYIVEFVLDHPAAYFPLLMALPVARPLPAESVSAGLVSPVPDGLLSNGPYLVDVWDRGERITFKPNPHYHDVATVPFTRIDILIAEAGPALAAYRDGRLDTVFLDPAPRSGVDPADLGAELEPCTYGIGFTLVKPPLDTHRVRLALSLAIDREELIRDVVAGSAVPAQTFTPPGVVAGPNGATEGVSFQPERARELLAQAGYTDGGGFPAISLLVPESEYAVGETIAAMWRETLHIDVTLSSQPAAQYLDTIDMHTPLTEMPHAWALGWCAEFPDAYAWSHAAFDVASPPTVSGAAIDPTIAGRITMTPGNNAARRTPNRFDELTEQAIAEHDAAARQALYVEAEDILLSQEVVVAPIYHYTRPVAAKPWLERSYFAYSEQPFSLWRVDERARNLALTPQSE